MGFYLSMSNRIFRRLFFTLLFFLASLSADENISCFILEKDQGWQDLEMSKKYFHHSELQRKWAFSSLGEASIPSAPKILDFGCGEGKLSSDMACLFPDSQVTGVDISESMLFVARAHFPEKYYPNLVFKSAKSLNFENEVPENHYDLITAFCVFHLVSNPQEVITNLKKALKPGGLLLIVYPATADKAFIQAAEESFSYFKVSHSKQTTGPNLRYVSHAKNILSQAGLEVKKIKEVSVPFPFFDREDYKTWLVATMSANWKIADEIQEDFFDHLIDRHELHNPQLKQSFDQTYHVLISRIVIEAYKPKQEQVLPESI